jgi:hypothetical protein
MRILLALAWVAAGFRYELGITLERAEMRLLARCGTFRFDKAPGQC